jgi:hypothetical protein
MYAVGGVRRVTYKDGTVQRVKLVELSGESFMMHASLYVLPLPHVSLFACIDAEYSVTYDVIESVPPVRYLSAIHTIKLRRITATKHTFVCHHLYQYLYQYYSCLTS